MASLQGLGPSLRSGNSWALQRGISSLSPSPVILGIIGGMGFLEGPGMKKIFALFLLLNSHITLSCENIECWLKKANDLVPQTKNKDKNIKEIAAKELEEACKNIIDLKLQELLNTKEKEGDETKLEKTLSLQADLAVLRTGLAFLQLQARYNGPAKKGEKPEEGGGSLEQLKLKSMEDKLNSKFQNDHNLRDQGKQLTNFFKFVKTNDTNHQVPESDPEKFLKALQSVSKESNPDQSDGMSPFKYHMTAEDITLMENLLRLAPPATTPPEPEASLFQKTFQNLVKNFSNRNFVQSDSADLRENVRHYKKDYNQAKKELHKYVKNAMEEYLKNPGHNCKNYYDALTGKNGKKPPGNDDLCLSSALREILSDKETNNLKGLIDYLEGIKFKINPTKIEALSADHARTMYADLKSCSITAKKISGQNCCEIKLKMYVEHLPGEDPAHAEWFIHQGAVDSIPKENDKYRRPSPEQAVAVAHADRKVHHHGDVTTLVPVCAKAEGDQLVMFGTRKKAEGSPPFNPMNGPIKANPKMRMLGNKDPAAIEAEAKYTSNARTISILNQCKEAQIKNPCYNKLGTALVITLKAEGKDSNDKKAMNVTPTLTIKKGNETPNIPGKQTWFCGKTDEKGVLTTAVFTTIGPNPVLMPEVCHQPWENNKVISFPRLSIDYEVEAQFSIDETIWKENKIASVYKSEKIKIPKLDAKPVDPECTLALKTDAKEEGDKMILTVVEGKKNCGAISTPAQDNEITWKLNCPKESPPIANQEIGKGLTITIPKKKTECTADAIYMPKEWKKDPARSKENVPAQEEKKPEDKEPEKEKDKEEDEIVPSSPKAPPQMPAPQYPPAQAGPPAMMPPQAPPGPKLIFEGTR